MQQPSGDPRSDHVEEGRPERRPGSPRRLARFRPGSDWLDTEGRPIEAHTGGMFHQDSTYYWVGASWETTDAFQAFNLYSSRNLQDWAFTSTLLRPSADLPASHEIARPKVLYNALTSSYVMWFKRKNYASPTNDVRAGVAVSESIEGPWSFLHDFFPGEGGPRAYNSADFCLWQEPDGVAYLVTSSPSLRGGPYERRIVIFRLTEDARGVEPEPVYVGPADDREAPAVFLRAGTYYLVTSGTSGWTPNQCAYRTAPSIEGPWSDATPLGDDTTFHTQPDFVFPVTGSSATTHVYAGGRHVAEDLDSSRYVWLPLTFAEGELRLEYLPSWILDLDSGHWEPPR